MEKSENLAELAHAEIEEDFFQNEVEEEEIAIKPYEVDCLPNDYNISVIMNLIQRGYLKIPSFQRNYVWRKDMASKFIESIIIGLPIPQVFLFEQERNNFLVIDGQQRLVTLYLFKNGRFPKNDKGRAIIREYLSHGKEIPSEKISGENFESFALKLPSTSGEPNPLDKKNYNTLPSSSEFDFKAIFDFNRTIRTITIRQITPSDDCSSMFEIFSRLNSGGITLKPQEIRMSLFYSDFYDKVIELNLNKSWRKFLGKEHPDLHMKEVEVLIRAFAMLEMQEEYKSPMKVFLNKFSNIARKFDELKIEELESIYNQFWDSCSHLNDNAFRNDQGKFVISLFEAVFVAACKLLKIENNQGKKISPESLKALKGNSSFIDLTKVQTAETSSVKNRIKIAIQYIKLQ